MSGLIKVGCCGFSGGRRGYFKLFDLVEVQSTFYRLPRVETVERWRNEAPEGFEFTMKAFQGLTHPAKSPTWRRSGLKLTQEEVEGYGFLRPTEVNYRAWRDTRRIAEALEASIVVLQCPPSFTCSEENVEGMRSFLSTIDRGSLRLAWEPRHRSWSPETVRRLCMELDLIHVVDPFKNQTQTYDVNPIYYRLHGLGSRAYRYRYTEEDLKTLYERYVKPFEEKGLEVYVLWNNIYMKEDALKFKEMFKV
ncbi:DUF72 domain-containing protein [Candidatus Bathyarchaeota archaeon]|nr:DUF72 domain-containing protein [Candidatus Bathyarchaeota archaeon]